MGTSKWPSDEELDALHMALGRLVTASAQMELHLRNVVVWLAGDHDAGWIVFEGQSVDWLVNTGKALLKEHREMARWPGERFVSIERALLDVAAINALRNRMVHGAWSRSCLDADDCVPRPRNSTPDDRVFHVYRSRSRKGTEEHQVAISDVEELIQRMYDVVPALHRARISSHRACLGHDAPVTASET